MAPDGTHVVFTSGTSGGVAVMDLTDGSIVGGDSGSGGLYTSPGGGGAGFAWSVDGRRFAMAGATELYLGDAAGSPRVPVELPVERIDYTVFEWGSDGRFYTTEGDPGQGPTLISFAEDGSDLRRYAPPPFEQGIYDSSMDVSGDASMAAYLAAPMTPAGASVLCLHDLVADEVEALPVTPSSPFTGRGFQHPAFSPDGELLAMVDPGEEDPEIWTYALDGDPAEPQLVGTVANVNGVSGLRLGSRAGHRPHPAATRGGRVRRDPATTERVAAADPTQAAVLTSQARFPAGAGGFAGAPAAAHVVLSRDDDFPDSLAGAALTGDGPLLFTARAALSPATQTEIQRVLAPGGTVYLLGGAAAIDPAVESALQALGYTTQRLAGPSRVETAIAVASEVRRLQPDVTEVLLARAFGAEGNPTSGWADSVTGGGYAAESGTPILITGSDSLHPAVAELLAADAPSRTVLLGGTAALSDAVQASVPNPQRVAGAERTATAAAIATELWQAPTDGPRRFVIDQRGAPAGLGLRAHRCRPGRRQRRADPRAERVRHLRCHPRAGVAVRRARGRPAAHGRRGSDRRRAPDRAGRPGRRRLHLSRGGLS